LTFRARQPDDLAIAALWALAAFCAIALAPLAPMLAQLAPACPLHALTGLACPTCGATRAALCLLEGRWSAALAINPLATVALVAGMVGGLVAPVWVIAGAPIPEVAHRRALRLLIVALLASNWIYLVARGV